MTTYSYTSKTFSQNNDSTEKWCSNSNIWISYHKVSLLLHVRKIFWKNKTLYPLALPSSVYQGVRSFDYPESFTHALNEHAVIVAETWRTTCEKYFMKVSSSVSRTSITSKMELFVTFVNSWKTLSNSSRASESPRYTPGYQTISKQLWPHYGLIKLRNMFSRFIFTFSLTSTEWQAF